MLKFILPSDRQAPRTTPASDTLATRYRTSLAQLHDFSKECQQQQATPRGSVVFSFNTRGEYLDHVEKSFGRRRHEAGRFYDLSGDLSSR